MIKFRGGNLIGFGLSEGNIKKLKKGQTIAIDMDEMGFPGIKALILYGNTEEDIQRELSEFIGPETKYSTTMDN